MNVKLPEALRMLGEHPELHTPVIVEKVARLVLAQVNEHGTWPKLQELIRITAVSERQSLCQQIVRWAEETRGSMVPGAPPTYLSRQEDLGRWVRSLRKQVETQEKKQLKAKQEQLEACLDKLDPLWRRRRMEAEIEAELRAEQANLREEQRKVRADRSTFSKTFSKSGGRLTVQGGAPGLGKR